MYTVTALNQRQAQVFAALYPSLTQCPGDRLCYSFINPTQMCKCPFYQVLRWQYEHTDKNYHPPGAHILVKWNKPINKISKI